MKNSFETYRIFTNLSDLFSVFADVQKYFSIIISDTLIKRLEHVQKFAEPIRRDMRSWRSHLAMNSNLS